MNDPLKTVKGAKAEKMVRLLAEGKSQKEAEKESGITKRAIVRDQALLDRITVLINNYTFDNAAASALVRARLMEIVLDPNAEDKDAVAASKVLTPIIGIEQVKKIIHRIEHDTPEARESLRYVEEYIEGEFEDIEEE